MIQKVGKGDERWYRRYSRRGGREEIQRTGEGDERWKDQRGQNQRGTRRNRRWKTASHYKWISRQGKIGWPAWDEGKKGGTMIEKERVEEGRKGYNGGRCYSSAPSCLAKHTKSQKKTYWNSLKNSVCEPKKSILFRLKIEKNNWISWTNFFCILCFLKFLVLTCGNFYFFIQLCLNKRWHIHI